MIIFFINDDYIMEEGELCMICGEDVSDTCYLYACNHMFHMPCYNEYLRSLSELKLECPVCDCSYGFTMAVNCSENGCGCNKENGCGCNKYQRMHGFKTFCEECKSMSIPYKNRYSIDISALLDIVGDRRCVSHHSNTDGWICETHYSIYGCNLEFVRFLEIDKFVRLCSGEFICCSERCIVGHSRLCEIGDFDDCN
jgi:Ring finger domain